VVRRLLAPAALAASIFVPAAALAQSAEETAAFLYFGLTDVPPLGLKVKRVSDSPFTLRMDRDDRVVANRQPIFVLFSVVPMDGCRYRFTFDRRHPLRTDIPNIESLNVDFSKTYYPRAIEQPIYRYRADAGSCTGSERICRAKAARMIPGRQPATRINAAIEYFNENFCKTKAF
jgi:hypothetical protein